MAKKVKKEFQNAVQLDPSNIQARLDLMEYCVSAPWIVGGSKDEARAQIEAIEKLDPIEGHLARGKYYLVEKKPDQAEREYREVLAAKPKRIEAYFDVAEFYVGQNKALELQTTIDAAAQIAPNDPRLAYYRGVQRVLSGTDQAHGEEYLKGYLESTPDRSEWALARVSAELVGEALSGRRETDGSGGAVSDSVAIGSDTQGHQGSVGTIGKEVEMISLQGNT